MFCKKCGSKLTDDASFCPSCGEAVNTTQSPKTSQVQYSVIDDASNVNDVQDNKAMAVLAYIGILVLIPIFGAKNSKYAQYHASQGLTLCIFNVAYSIIVAIIKAILFNVLPWTMLGFYAVISMILSLGYIAFLVFAIMGIVNAAQGRTKELPIIGKIDILGKLRKK